MDEPFKEAQPPRVHLNANRTFPITYDSGAVLVDLAQSKSQNFWENLSRGLMLRYADVRGTLHEVRPVLDEEARQLTFDVPQAADRSQPLQLTMNRQPVSEFVIEQDGQLRATDKHKQYQLIVTETRGMSYELNPPTLLPYDRSRRNGYDASKHAAITDLHTHSSSQVRASDVMRAALELDREADAEHDAGKREALYVTYPVELLTRLGVPPTAKQKVLRSRSYEFVPMQHEGLECERGPEEVVDTESGVSVKKKVPAMHDAVRLKDLSKAQRDAIIRVMDSEEDGTKRFIQVERENYRHFNPLVKNPRITRKLLRSMAQDYAAQGIEYAEVATSSLLDPTWFEAMAREIDAIEHGSLNADGSRNNDALTVGPEHKPFRMRFLAGLPRKTPPDRTIDMLERIKFLARHPYVVGIDLMGNETNKTSDFNWALSNMAMWVRKSEDSELKPDKGWNFKEDFVVRVHAGETAKNFRNVGEAVRIAYEHKVRVRVGHAQNEAMDADEWRMIAHMKEHDGEYDAKLNEKNPQDWFGFEKCLDSNQFYGMWPLVHQVKLAEHARRANTTLGQDGNGMVHSSPRQQAFSALAAGMTLDDLERMHEYERGYIRRQFERDKRKTAAFDALYPQGLSQFMKAYRGFNSEHVINARFKDKQAFMIGGASGSSWNALDKLDQAQIEQMMEVLVRVLDPKKVYFVLGRVQNEGVSKALDIAIKRHNLAHPENKFQVHALYAPPRKGEPSGELPETVSRISLIDGGPDMVVEGTVDYARENDAKCLFFGGAQFTSDIILGMHDPKGGQLRYAAFLPKKSEVFGRVREVTNPEAHIRGLQDFIERVLTGVGDKRLFKDANERKALIRKEVQMDDPAQLQQLLEDVMETWKSGQHVSATKGQGRAKA